MHRAIQSRPHHLRHAARIVAVGLVEQSAKVLTWGADDHLLITAATVAWLLTRKSEEPLRRLSTHVLACSLLTAILPHILKGVIEQERPDRRTIGGHWRGIPFSGKSSDAFPSGHALSALWHPLLPCCPLKPEI
jgi:membrane-associated phospholipid phosphatase